MPAAPDRESVTEIANPLGLRGIEFIEYATLRPQALGQALESMGFLPVARHRSREVTLYRQGAMNVVVNAHRVEGEGGESGERGDRGGDASAVPADPPLSGGDGVGAATVSAIGLRVRDAAAAWRRVRERGAWPVATQVEVMELNIPAIHGVGGSRIYFVDRWRESAQPEQFSIYDVDFVPIPGAPRDVPAVSGLHWFGVVQYVGIDRTEDWTEFFLELFGFDLLPNDQRFGILPKGRILRSPCRTFYLQLVEPDWGQVDAGGAEYIQRLGLGSQDVPAAVAALRMRGVEFVETDKLHTDVRGALTAPLAGGAVFELVHDKGHGA